MGRTGAQAHDTDMMTLTDGRGVVIVYSLFLAINLINTTVCILFLI